LLRRQEARWPKSDSCLLPASPCEFLGRCSCLTEAEVRLSEHRELRQALGLVSVPDFTTLYRFLQRLDEATIDCAVSETVRRLRGTRRKGRRRARVAVDATGLAQGAVSTFFVRRMHHHGQKPLAGGPGFRSLRRIAITSYYVGKSPVSYDDGVWVPPSLTFFKGGVIDLKFTPCGSRGDDNDKPPPSETEGRSTLKFKIKGLATHTYPSTARGSASTQFGTCGTIGYCTEARSLGGMKRKSPCTP
jgi:hypothetical protein